MFNLEPTLLNPFPCLVDCILSFILILHTQNEEGNYVAEMKIFPEQNVNERLWGYFVLLYY